MAVRAKFTVMSITHTAHWQREKGTIGTVKLAPVTNGSEEDKRFWDATPSGTIELGMINKAAVEQFEIGKTFYVDFTPVE